jgi:hypothetical protein
MWVRLRRGILFEQLLGPHGADNQVPATVRADPVQFSVGAVGAKSAFERAYPGIG